MRILTEHDNTEQTINISLSLQYISIMDAPLHFISSTTTHVDDSLTPSSAYSNITIVTENDCWAVLKDMMNNQMLQEYVGLPLSKLESYIEHTYWTGLLINRRQDISIKSILDISNTSLAHALMRTDYACGPAPEQLLISRDTALQINEHLIFQYLTAPTYIEAMENIQSRGIHLTVGQLVSALESDLAGCLPKSQLHGAYQHPLIVKMLPMAFYYINTSDSTYQGGYITRLKPQLQQQEEYRVELIDRAWLEPLDLKKYNTQNHHKIQQLILTHLNQSNGQLPISLTDLSFVLRMQYHWCIEDDINSTMYTKFKTLLQGTEYTVIQTKKNVVDRVINKRKRNNKTELDQLLSA